MAGRAIINVDGAAKGNPGPAGIGVAISDESGRVLRQISEYIGEATNNVAEYSALVRGLTEALEAGYSEVAVYTDSELMARQIEGRYKVKADGLTALYESAKALLGKFKSATVTHVPRAKNKLADKLASAAAQQAGQPELFEEKPEKPKTAKRTRREEPVIQRLSIKTSSRTQFLLITDQIQEAVDSSGVSDGICMVFVPHTTAGVTINETADPYVMRDIIDILNGLVPQSLEYRHREGNADAHAKAAMIGSSVSIFVENGKLVLGTWQGIFFCEFDGPRPRDLLVRVG